jgi:hypothetical protein
MATYTLVINTAGADGAATGSAQTPPLDGFVEGIKVVPHASLPATTDLTATEEAEGSEATLAQTLLTLTNLSTATATYYPQHAHHDTTGADNGRVGMFKVKGRLQVALAQSNALAAAVTVTIRVLEATNVE